MDDMYVYTSMYEDMFTKEELEVVRQLELEEVGNEREAKGFSEGFAEGLAEIEQEDAEKTYNTLIANGMVKELAEELVRQIYKKADFSFLL